MRHFTEEIRLEFRYFVQTLPYSLKRIKRKVIVFSLLIALWVACAAGPSTAATLNVPGSYSTIQDAIDAASAGDEVVIANGTYTGTGNKDLDFKGKAITVRSASGDPSKCVIDCEQDGRGFYFHSFEGLDSIVKDLRVYRGKVPAGEGGGVHCDKSSPKFINCYIHHCTTNSLSWAGKGGGVYCKDCAPKFIECYITYNSAGSSGGMSFSNYSGSGVYPELIDCLIKENTAHRHGGGIMCSYSAVEMTNCTIEYNTTIDNDGHGGGCYFAHCNPELTDCMITDNTAYEWGGGVYMELSKARFYDCTIEDNQARRGGGLYCYNTSNAVLNDCIIAYNTSNYWGNGQGGGIYCNLSDPKLNNCTLLQNSASDSGLGGGLFCMFTSYPKLINCTFSKNSATKNGGGAYFYQDNNPTFINCMITGNGAGKEGGGVYCYKNTDLELVNCTFAGNGSNLYGAALCCDSYAQGYPSDVEIVNCIFWNGTYQIWNWDSSTIDISYSDIQGGWTGTNNIDIDPQFVSPAAGDYHLLWNSPCRDVGDNSVVTENKDIDDDPRIAFTTVDMGADEFYDFTPHMYCTGDFTPGGSITGKFVGMPATWPVGLFIGSGILNPPMQHRWGLFYLASPWVLFPLVPIPASGMLEIPATIPTTPYAPYDIPMQALIGDKLTPLFVLEVR